MNLLSMKMVESLALVYRILPEAMPRRARSLRKDGDAHICWVMDICSLLEPCFRKKLAIGIFPGGVIIICRITHGNQR